MQKFTFTSLFIGLLSFFVQPAHAQDKKEQIAKVINDYFFLERENIHVHLDKNVFLSNESIWFKGYVFHRKYNIPFYSSVNIFASIIDDQGNIIETKLLYGDIGSFSGSFTLGENFKSGKYYLQFYTNWMNNFTEDESAVYDITIINEATGIPGSLKNREYSDINISLKPESGTLIQGINNVVGVSVLNCNNDPTKATEAEIIDHNGQSIKKIPLNKAGYGKFDITPIATQTYKVLVHINGTTYEQPVMLPQLKGVTLEVNSYTMADKTSLKVRTNEASLSSFANTPLYIVANKDEKSAIFSFSFSDKKQEQSITLSNTDLFEGLNTIRILDSDLNLMAERLIYIYPQIMLNTQLSKTKDLDGQVELTGTVTKPNMNLSIAVLPAESISFNEDSDILGDLLITPYLKNHQKLTARAYLTNITRSSKYELDLYLLNQESKYKWSSILSIPPKQNYTFEMGLEVKGTINQTIKSPKDYKIRVQSLANMIDETVQLDEKKEFSLKNLILTDSTSLNFTLLKKGEKPVPLKVYPQIFNNNRKFNKPYKPKPVMCSTNEMTDLRDSIKLPKYVLNSITLDEIEIKASVVPKLKHQKTSGNSQLRAYKITELDSRNFFYVLDLIRYHGFDVSTTGSDVSITGRTINTINGQRTMPMVYIDNIRVLDFAYLLNIQTSDIDEFYINQHAVVPSVDNKMGIIRIYMKKEFLKTNTNTSNVAFTIKDGFEKVVPFENTEYFSTSGDKGFENFGLIDWHPTVVTDEKGNFKINVPKMYSGSIKVIIEGFSPDGKLISEVKTITL